MAEKPSRPRRTARPAVPDAADPLTVQARRIAAASVDDELQYAPAISLERYYAHYERDSDAGDHFRLTRALVTAARRWRKVANDRVRSIGQSMARWETLFLVAFSDRLSVAELASLLGIEGPTMVRMLQVLERDGLITREQSATDRRVSASSITPDGEKVIEDIKAITRKLREEVLSDLDHDELVMAQRVLSKIILKLDEMR
jgi:DNA-binding MarR family transcriptional regulator